jgi:UDP-N-acetylmuramoyl-tripeptide--D-alanyl-D-alanine ligase
VHYAGREIGFSFAARHQATNAIAALTVCEALGIPLPDEIVDVSFSRWRSEESDLPGGGLLINDAWNANPVAMRAALEYLVERAAGRRTIAILGEMAELGENAAAYHDEIGRLVRDLAIDHVFAVGPMAKHYTTHVNASTWSPKLEDLVEQVRDELEPGDVVLVKGSRSVGLEFVASALAGVTAP